MDEKESLKANDQLKIIFSLLKEISEGTVPNASDYGISNQIFFNLIDAMQDDGLIKDAGFARAEGKVLIAFIEDAKVTIRGLEYLHENSALMKTYKGLKEVRDWIPFIY